MLALLWLAFAATAFRAIRRRDVAAHRRWMVRTFALTDAAVTLRLWLAGLILVQIGPAGVDPDVAFHRAYLLVPFLAWVPNLLVAERHPATRHRRSAHPSADPGGPAAGFQRTGPPSTTRSAWRPTLCRWWRLLAMLTGDA